jgi:hypothetical protein
MIRSHFSIATLSGLLLAACATPHAAPSLSLPHLPRADFRSGGGDAELTYLVYGHFHSTIAVVDGRKYRTNGAPDQVTASVLPISAPICSMLLFPEMRGVAGRTPAIDQALEDATECIAVHGRVADPADLDYLRDLVGLVMGLSDRSGTVVFDADMMKCWLAADFRREIFDHVEEPHRHVQILISEDDAPGAYWVHTRGLLHFGRPDLSFRHVSEHDVREVIHETNVLITKLAAGRIFDDGAPAMLAELPGLTFSVVRSGDQSDPDFNNAHYEVVRSRAR